MHYEVHRCYSTLTSKTLVRSRRAALKRRGGATSHHPPYKDVTAVVLKRLCINRRCLCADLHRQNLRSGLDAKVARWTGMHKLMLRMAAILKDWKMLGKEEEMTVLDGWAKELKGRGLAPPQLTREPPRTQTTVYASGECAKRNKMFVTQLIGDVVLC